MFNYYQPYLLPFLKNKSNKIPSNLKQIYYYSFEDGLWDILRHKFPNQKVKFLVPNFYCSDVLDNIRRHGHDYVYYPLDKNFQISPALISRYLWLNLPDIFIIFHACGITSNLLLDTSWVKDLPKTSLIIEDSVHRMVNPQLIKLLNNRHLVLDSLRKVSPFPGSCLFGDKSFLNFSPKRVYNLYFVKTLVFYLLFRIFFKLGFIQLAHKLLLKQHDDIIGDEYGAQKGLAIFLPLISRIDYSKVEKLKYTQVSLYEKYLKPIFKNRFYYHVQFPRSDFRKLHVYPLGINYDPQSILEKKLNQLGYSVWYKFTDCPWSETRRVLFLPLGFHIKEKMIKNISTILIRFPSPKLGEGLRVG